MGGRVGPVLRNEPHDSATAAIDWPDQIQREAARPRTGRFRREPARTEQQETLRR